MFGQRTSVFVKERVALMKLQDSYDLLDPDNKGVLGEAKDEPETWAKWLRLIVKKQYLPTTVNVYANGETKVALSIKKRPGIFRTRLEIFDHTQQCLAQIRSKVFSLGGAFVIYDPAGQEIGQMKGDWKGWDYAATVKGQAIGIVTKKWAGVLKEVFTSADQYLVKAERPEQLPLLLGLALAVDLVYKEQKG